MVGVAVSSFSRNVVVAAVVSFALIVAGLGAAPAYADPASSLTVHSIGRTSTGALSYDVTANVSDYRSTACYWSSCQLYLEFIPANATADIVVPEGYIYDEPYTHEFIGSVAASTVSGAFLFVSDHSGYDTPFSSAVVSITTDPYPTSPGASVVVNSITRTSGGC